MRFVCLKLFVFLAFCNFLGLCFEKIIENKEESEVSVGEVERLLREFHENQELVRNIGNKFYQIIYPIQIVNKKVKGISTRHTSGKEQNNHFRQTSLLIKAFQHKFRLDLKLNSDLFSTDLQIKIIYTSGGVMLSKKDVEHCYYHGTVRDFSGKEFIPGSMAAIQTCQGISGIVHLGNETFVIQPFYGGDLSSKHPHIIYEHSFSKKQSCAVSSFKENQQKIADFADLTANFPWNGYYIRAGVIIDNSVFAKRKDHSRNDVLRDIFQITNIIDLYFFESLKIRIRLSFLEGWQKEQKKSRSSDIFAEFASFQKYTKEILKDINVDTFQKITSSEHFHVFTTIATVSDLCKSKGVGLSEDTDPFEPHIVASNIAHAIGHNIGMHHDDLYDNCNCQDWHGCIMKASIVGQNGIQPYKFSTCSINRMHEMKKCLIKKTELSKAFCGNGKIEGNEQCDCGNKEMCHEFDPCCNPDTCLYYSWVQCTSGLCCNNCTLASAGDVCREKRNECDLEEKCDGINFSCPEDSFLQNFYPCGNGEGFCFNGNCPTWESQCLARWGDDARPFPKNCIHTFFEKQRCENSHSLCQKHYLCKELLCVKNSPSFKEKEKLNCRKISRSQILRANIWTEDGTKCGSNEICFNNSCLSISSYKNLHQNPCEDNVCSEGTECSDDAKCKCTKINSSERCLTSRNSNTNSYSFLGSTPSNTYVLKESDSDTVIMVIVLVAGVGGVFILFALMALCYRRKSSIPKYDSNPFKNGINIDSFLKNDIIETEDSLNDQKRQEEMCLTNDRNQSGILKRGNPNSHHHLMSPERKIPIDESGSTIKYSKGKTCYGDIFFDQTNYHDGILKALQAASTLSNTRDLSHFNKSVIKNYSTIKNDVALDSNDSMNAKNGSESLRIRNLEDLIRQLEQSSRHDHSVDIQGKNWSSSIKYSRKEYGIKCPSFGKQDQIKEKRRPNSPPSEGGCNSDASGTVISFTEASRETYCSSAKQMLFSTKIPIERKYVNEDEQANGVETVSQDETGALTPGSTFDVSDLESNDILRAHLLHSNSEDDIQTHNESFKKRFSSIPRPGSRLENKYRFAESPIPSPNLNSESSSCRDSFQESTSGYSIDDFNSVSHVSKKKTMYN